MSDQEKRPKTFIEEAETIVLENLSNENFGVSELSEAMHMSRSNLLRKIKKETGLSASKFISQVRLVKSMEILKESQLTVSEVSYKVGFGSTSYFIKCFREYYGYPPGEVGRNEADSAGSKSRQRQLVAIMFTDIAGYTSLMQKDEDLAIAYRERHREVFDSTTKKYNGRILQYYGDGTLSTFTSAVDAVQCAIEMQLAFKNEEPRIPIRVGIHSGDIIVSDQDIIGDGVNIAARVESLAQTGSVYISAKVHDELKNHPEFITASRGVHTLKNVAKPIEVYEVSNYQLGELENKTDGILNTTKGNPILKWAAIVVGVALIVLLVNSIGLFNKKKLYSRDGIEYKSIAVLPFANESTDSTNTYFVNGLMQSTLSSLQKIKSLKVTSRTSSEKYRGAQKSIPEIADELEVTYIVEGSGQKIGDQVMLSIQLIDAETDQPLWSEQYNREFADVFSLQNEVAKEIAVAIKAVITRDELEILEKQLTENVEAYDYYLQGLELYYTRKDEQLKEAIEFFEKAIEADNEFAEAYAHTAIAYHYLDASRTEKQYTEQINQYSDKALLYDAQSDICLISKALYYVEVKEFDLALPHLEKALEYNPNSGDAIKMLASFYAFYSPNTDKYLEYALKGKQLNLENEDSTAASYDYIHLSNALLQAGFFDQAKEFVDKAVLLEPNNYFAQHLDIFIGFAQDTNYTRAAERLTVEWKKDPSRLDYLQDIGKLYYGLRQYDSAYVYYQKLVDIREQYNSNQYVYENVKIAYVYREMGEYEKADELFADYMTYSEQDQTIYKSITKAMAYAYSNEVDKALSELAEFSEEDNFQYWMLLIETDPLVDTFRETPKFQKFIDQLKTKFWNKHDDLEKRLVSEGLI